MSVLQPAAAEGLLDLKLGACVPDTCSDKELTLFVAEGKLYFS